MKTIELIKAIGSKHGTYCTFTIRSGHKGGKADYASCVVYQTYISSEINPHRDHETEKEANERFKEFLDAEDLDIRNIHKARSLLIKRRQEIEDLEEDALELENKILESMRTLKI